MTTILARKIALSVCGLAISGAALSDTLKLDHAPSIDTVSTCPTVFHSIAVPVSAKQCQLFDTAVDDSVFPASMVYFMADNKENVINFYQQAIPGLTVHSTFNQRTLLVAKNNAIRVVVSPDGNGTQVDILVTAKS